MFGIISRNQVIVNLPTCGREYKTSGNTSNLQDHIKQFHPIVTEADETSPSSHIETTESQSSFARSIRPFFKRSIQYDSTSKRKIDLDQALTFMITTDLQAFSVVNDIGFRRFLNLLDPKYVIRSKFTIREKIMKDMYNKCALKLKGILKDIHFFAINTDSWTSISTESYLTITCHFVDQNFNVNGSLLVVPKVNEH